MQYMAFAPVPQEPKKQIDKAGKILISGPERHGKAYYDALELANKWRACHAYPINTFQSTLRVKIRNIFLGREPIVAQRLKRMPTIIDKLNRLSPNMQLTTMQDIGGVRAILETVDSVYRLAHEYRNSQRLMHELTQEKDYIKNPRDEDGYRSLHLIYKYKNKLAPAYNGLRLELQIRTKLQHIWATAVETMGTFLGQDLKSRKGERAWIDFFAVTSSAFAHQEKSPLVPRYNHLSLIDTCRAVAEAEAKIRALETMEALAMAADNIVAMGGTRRVGPII